MKYMESTRLAELSHWLGSRELGDRVLGVRLDLFSCKKAGDDKKLSRQLDEHMRVLGESPGTSPSFGLLRESSVRKTLIDLITTMNASFPDYDFSGVTVDHFLKQNVETVWNQIRAHLAEVNELYDRLFLDKLKGAIDEAVKLKDCEVYSYAADSEDDPFSDGCLWSFNYFFVNNEQKKILYFTCIAQSKYAAQNNMSLDSSEHDEEQFSLDG